MSGEAPELPPPDVRFGARWSRRPGFEDEAATAEAWNLKVGWGAPELAGAAVLDGGCGAGRFSAIAHQLGAARVVGVDVSEQAVAAARENVPAGEFQRHDLMEPLPKRLHGAFDRVITLGVLHHTPDPARGLRHLAAALKPGGTLAVWVYCTTPHPWVAAARSFLHDLTRACPTEVLHQALERHMPALTAAWHEQYVYANEVFQFPMGVADTSQAVDWAFDWHVPLYRSEHPPAEVEAWCRAAGLKPYRSGPFPTTVHASRIT